MLNSIHYRVHELDLDRLWQAQQATDLLSLLDTNQASRITLDHVAAAAAYIAANLLEVLGNTHRALDVPADGLADTL